MGWLRSIGIGLVMTVALAGSGVEPALAQSSTAQKSSSDRGNQEPPTQVAGTFGNWTLLCGTKEANTAKERCSLVLPLVEKESQKLVFRVVFTYGPQGKLVMRVDGPTGIALQRGLEFSPDTQKLYRMPYQTCLPKGCKALLIVEDALREEMTNSKQGTITVYALNGRPVRTVAALDGFSAGMKALDQKLNVKR